MIYDLDLWEKISGQFLVSKLNIFTVFCLQIKESLKAIDNYNALIYNQKQEFDDLYDYIINENSLEYEEEEEEEDN